VYDACGEASVSWAELLARHLPVDPPDVNEMTKLLGTDELHSLCRQKQLDVGSVLDWLPGGRFQVYARAAHVLAEADRVYAFKNAMAAGQLTVAGLIANASHSSCRDLYHISTPGLETLAGLARRSGATGVRITGAGWLL
jgi:galactokinase